MRSTDAFPTNTDLEVGSCLRAGLTPPALWFHERVRSRLSNRQLCSTRPHTEGLSADQQKAGTGGWRTSGSHPRLPIRSTHQSQVAAQRTVPMHLNHLRFRPGTGAKAEKEVITQRPSSFEEAERGGKEGKGGRTALRRRGPLLTVGITAHFRGEEWVDLGWPLALAHLHLPGFGGPFVFTFSRAFRDRLRPLASLPVLAQQAVVGRPKYLPQPR